MHVSTPNIGRTISEVAELVGGSVLRGDPARLVKRVMPTDLAEDDAVTFITKAKYIPKLAATRAACVMIAPDMLARDDVAIPASVAVIGVDRPYVAFARAAQAFAEKTPQPLGVHAASVIEASASIGKDVAIGPFVYVGPRAVIGDGAVLYPGVHVEAGASVGEGTVLYNHVVVRHGCKVGARCIIHPGVVVGSDGFGFAADVGQGGVTHVKIPQVGDVRIEDDVEIGSNSCIDRAALGTTRIGAGTKIDNLVQVGHNVDIGPGCILVAQSGVAGSSRLGRGVILAAQSGVSGHLEIGDGALVNGQSGVTADVPAGAKVMGSPSVPYTDHVRSLVRIAKLDSLFSRVKKLERLLEARSDRADDHRTEE